MLRRRARFWRIVILAATGPKGGTSTDARLAGSDIPPPLRAEKASRKTSSDIMFAHTETSQAKGLEFLGRFMARTEDRDAPTNVALRDAQYDAIVEWGIPDHAALQRLTAIKTPTLIIQGDGDLMIPPELSHLMAGLIPDPRIRIYPDAAHGFLFEYPDRGRHGSHRISDLIAADYDKDNARAANVTHDPKISGQPRDAERPPGRGRPVRGDRGPADESSRARAGPRSGLAHSARRGRQRVQVLVFKSADPDYFISHVDVTKIKEYRRRRRS